MPRIPSGASPKRSSPGKTRGSSTRGRCASGTEWWHRTIGVTCDRPSSPNSFGTVRTSTGATMRQQVRSAETWKLGLRVPTSPLSLRQEPGGPEAGSMLREAEEERRYVSDRNLAGRRRQALRAQDRVDEAASTEDRASLAPATLRVRRRALTISSRNCI